MNDEMIVQEGGGEAKISRTSTRTRRIPPSPERALVGKIARLPKAIREQVNRRLEDGQPVSVMVPWLNELPAVKKVLAAYFGGAEVTDRNVSNWRSTGYQRWLRKQEELAELKELAEDAADFSRAAGEKLGRGTVNLAALKILKMLREMPSDKWDPDQLIKLAFATAALAQVEQNNVRLKYEQTRVYQGNERLVLSWDKHMRDCVAIAQRVMDDELAKDIQDADIDNGEKIELLGHHLFGKKWHGRKVGAGSTRGVGSTHGPSAPPGAPSAATPSVRPNEDPMQANANGDEGECLRRSAGHTCRAPLRGGEGEQPQKNTKSTESGEARPDAGTEEQQKQTKVTKISGEGDSGVPPSGTLPVSVGEGEHRRSAGHACRAPLRGGEGEQPQKSAKSTKSGEGDHEGMGRPGQTGRILDSAPKHDAGGAMASDQPNAESSTLPKPGLSDYEKAIVEGKTSLEAMYSQFSRPKDPPPPREPIPCEPPYRYYAMSRQPDPQRPPPEWNSLG